MATKTQVKEEIEIITGINTVVETYEEIAAIKIRKTRDSVLKTRAFLDEIKLVFEQVRMSYKKEINSLVKKKKGKKNTSFDFLSNNGKTLYVLLSSNTGLYGDIIKRTFDYFYDEVQKNQGDLAIVGRYGRTIFEEKRTNKEYTYFDFSDNDINPDSLKPLIDFMIKYENVIVYFGKFENLVRQDPVGYDVSATPIEAATREKMTLAKYIFEPSLEKILEFFETEIFASIVEQTIRESQLGKFASRMVALDKSIDNIKKRSAEMKFLLNKTTHSQQNRGQLETFSSMKLWKKY